jgi:hypothetical protein
MERHADQRRAKPVRCFGPPPEKVQIHTVYLGGVLAAAGRRFVGEAVEIEGGGVPVSCSGRAKTICNMTPPSCFTRSSHRR